jgi:hypothetical protein
MGVEIAPFKIVEELGEWLKNGHVWLQMILSNSELM